MTKAFAASAVLAALLVIGCQPTETPTSTTGSSTTVTGTMTKTEAVPESLKNDAYHYYGLERSEPTKFLFTMDKNPSTEGTEQVTFKGVENGKAKYEVVRTGALEDMGAREELVLDDKGLTIVATSPGVLNGTVLTLPASMETGATWNTDYSVLLKGKGALKPNEKGEMVQADTTLKDHNTFKVVGPQKVTTKAGTFDAILVESDGDETIDQGSGPQNFKLKTQSWYVKGRGAVKIVLNTTQGPTKRTLTIEAAGDATKP